MERETHLAEVLRYVVLNPVRAGMFRRPEDYRWSSYRATAGLELAPEWLDVSAALAMFGKDEQLAQEAYRTFVLAAIGSKIGSGAR